MITRQIEPLSSRESQPRHILGLSGGKDSTALAIYLRDRIPEMEYVFLDTGKELPETYEYLGRIEAFLGKSIIRLNADYSFDHFLEVFGGYLPSPTARWCTKNLKLKPFERYVGDGLVYSYVAIRADEDRVGHISHKKNLVTKFPFREDGIVYEDVMQILRESGIGLPSYYSWRTRSGCYFCFFQRKSEWVGLKREHPDLFEMAKSYEKLDSPDGRRFTWARSESLDELEQRADKIGAGPERRTTRSGDTLLSVFTGVDDDDPGEACLICHL